LKLALLLKLWRVKGTKKLKTNTIHAKHTKQTQLESRERERESREREAKPNPTSKQRPKS
jgi:hypothetical protein